MRILIVEDEPKLASVIRRGLEEQGYQPLVAENAAEAVVIVRSGHLALMLLDVSFPDRDGHAVLAEARRRRRDLPVSMVTARDDVASTIEALNSGANDYIARPFNVDV